MNTETGQIVRNLHESKVGGFSWACPGIDGGTKNVTHLAGFAGFDYVLNPNFAHNRGYVLESVGNEQMILESISAVVKDDARAEQYARYWQSDFRRVYRNLKIKSLSLRLKAQIWRLKGLQCGI